MVQRRDSGRRGPSPAASGLVLVLAGAALFVVFGLPRWAEQRAAREAVQAPPVLEETAMLEETAIEESLEESPRQAVDEPPRVDPGVDDPGDPNAAQVAARLAEGRDALAAGDGYAAALAFERVLEIESGNAEAVRGLGIAKRLDELRGLLAEAAEAEQQGRFSAARLGWQRALALDPGATEARQGLARLAKGERADAFSKAMSEALAAFERDALEASLEALKRAEAVGHDAEEVAGLRTEIAERARELQTAEWVHAAAALESEERWSEARELYRKLLETDATLAVAQDGAHRSAARLELDRKLEAHLAGSARLSTDAVLEDARSSLASAREVSSPGPRLTKQIERLDRLVAEVSVPVAVVLESDRETEVVVYQVGQLGRFDRHEMQLRPGQYTVVGKRRGYRDVRLSLVVKPGKPASLDVRCKETI